MTASSVTETLQQVEILFASGNLAGAATRLRQALATHPTSPELRHILGVVELQCGRIASAVSLIQQAATALPADPYVQANFGEALRRSNQVEAAVHRLKLALALQPQQPHAFNNLGSALFAMGNLAGATGAIRAAIRLNPNYANAYNNLGNCLRERTHFEQARSCYEQAVKLQPNSAEIHANLGSLFRELGELDPALASFRQSAALDPSDPEPCSQIAVALALQGRIEDSLPLFRQAVQLDPAKPDLHSNLALIMLYDPETKPEKYAAELQTWSDRHERALPTPPRPLVTDFDPLRRLRIGYLSPDFRAHIVGWNLLPLFRHQQNAYLETFGYADVREPEETTGTLRSCCDHWRFTPHYSHEQLAEIIRQDRIDILVDLSLHTEKNRLPVFARKPAPLQVSFAGYPGTTGLRSIDYHLTDPYLEPIDASREPSGDKPFRLPSSFWCYEPRPTDPAVNPLPAAGSGHITFGCLNNLLKVNQFVLELWSRVLEAVPRSQLILFAPTGGAREYLLRQFGRFGITPQRVQFVPRLYRQAYLQAYHQIDVGLDSFPYNGHSTSLDSYWMGVPVVTLVGQNPVSRAGWSQLSNLQLTEFAAQSPEEFVKIACTVTADLERLAALRASLRERMRQSPLMDARGFSQGICAAFRTIWQQHCAEVARRVEK